MKDTKVKKCSIKILLFLIVFVVSILGSGDNKQVEAAKNGWVKSGSVYKYKVNNKYVKNKIVKVKKKYYYLNKAGIRQTGWITYKKNKYYFDERKGYAYTGKKKIENDYYIFKSNGKLVKKQGYYTLKGKKYYINSDGKLARGVKKIGKSLYLFNENGQQVKKTGLHEYNEKKYYVKSNGKLVVGWYTVSGKKMYFDKQDAALVTGKTSIGNTEYHFDKNGKLYNGIFTVDNKLFYSDQKGKVVKSAFINFKGNRYYADTKGILVTGVKTINGKKYYFDNKAVMKTGIIKMNNLMYYFGTNGELVTNALIRVNNKRYYADSTGSFVTGMRTIDNKKYYFLSDYSANTGFLKIGDNIYYFATDGTMTTNSYINVGGRKYFATESGRLKRNCWYEGHYFNNQGYIVDDAVVFEDNDEGFVTTSLLDELSLAKCTKLMIVAHPDDDTLWGGAHLAEGGYLVVCLTNGYNAVRRNEFLSVMQASNNIGIILTYPDLVNGKKSDWSAEKSKIAKDIDTILNYKRWGLVVTHNPQGEYGHIHHKMTNKIVTEMYYKNYWANNLYYFGKYYKKNELINVADQLAMIPKGHLAKKIELLQLYKSQQKAINDHWHYIEYENWIRASEW